MAGTLVKRRGLLMQPESVVRELVIQHNKAVTDIETLRATLSALIADVTAIRTSVTGITAQLDLDAGVTDTNYAATNDPAALTVVAADVNAAGDMTAAQIGDDGGTAYAA